MRRALTELELAAERIAFIDRDHFEMISELASKISDNRISNLNAFNVHAHMNKAHSFIAVLAIATQLATGVSLTSRKKGRPGHSHLSLLSAR